MREKMERATERCEEVEVEAEAEVAVAVAVGVVVEGEEVEASGESDGRRRCSEPRCN